MSSGPLSDWTEERVETLKALVTEGLSCAQIARVLGGVTRSAVIGKVHRLGLSNARSRGSEPGEHRQVRPHALPAPPSTHQAPPSPKGEPAPMPLESGTSVTLLTAAWHHCRWPKWSDTERQNFIICGNQKVEGSPYCEFHRRLSMGKGTTGERAAHRGAAE